MFSLFDKLFLALFVSSRIRNWCKVYAISIQKKNAFFYYPMIEFVFTMIAIEEDDNNNFGDKFGNASLSELTTNIAF